MSIVSDIVKGNERIVVESITNGMERGYAQVRRNEDSPWGEKRYFVRNIDDIWFTGSPQSILSRIGIETTVRRAEDFSNMFDGSLTGFYYALMASPQKNDEAIKIILGYISETFRNRGIDISRINFHLPAPWLAHLITCLEDGTVPKKHQKAFIDELIDWDKTDNEPIDYIVEKLMSKPEYEVMDNSLIDGLIEKVFADNAKIVEEVKTNPKKSGFLIGQIMKLSGGKASPQDVARLVNEKLKSC